MLTADMSVLAAIEASFESACAGEIATELFGLVYLRDSVAQHLYMLPAVMNDDEVEPARGEMIDPTSLQTLGRLGVEIANEMDLAAFTLLYEPRTKTVGLMALGNTELPIPPQFQVPNVKAYCFYDGRQHMAGAITASSRLH